jgi:protein transport protein SEC24
MANPQGYPAQGYSQEEYDQSQSGTPGPASQLPAKKKRAYAGQAFEFGTGANAGQPATQAVPPAAAYGAAQPAAGYGYGAPVQQATGYPDPQQQQPAAAYGAPAAGYQPPDAYGAAPGGVPGMTQQFSQMGMAPQQQQQQQPAQAPQQAAPAAQRLNPLQPVDISVQGAPFHVSDLDLPPPSIILPPNVRLPPCCWTGCLKHAGPRPFTDMCHSLA